MKEKDREVCLCFHVPLGKLVKHYRLHQPRVASQLSQCYSAGTGCGWCVPFLERLFEQLQQGQPPDLGLSPEEYQKRRKEYHREKKIKTRAEEAEAPNADPRLGQKEP